MFIIAGWEQNFYMSTYVFRRNSYRIKHKNTICVLKKDVKKHVFEEKTLKYSFYYNKNRNNILKRVASLTIFWNILILRICLAYFKDIFSLTDF